MSAIVMLVCWSQSARTEPMRYLPSPLTAASNADRATASGDRTRPSLRCCENGLVPPEASRSAVHPECLIHGPQF